jgi:hypothetical protein
MEWREREQSAGKDGDIFLLRQSQRPGGLQQDRPCPRNKMKIFPMFTDRGMKPKNFMPVFLWASLVFFLSSNLGVLAQQGGERTAPYLELGAGGMQDAMAGAAVADRNDPACGYWNPAGLSGLRGFQIEDQYSLLSLGQQLDYFSLAKGFRDIVFLGLSGFYYSAGGDLQARVGPSLMPDSVFGDTEFTFLISLAFKLDPRWSLGGNLKVMTQSFDSISGFGFGEDLGLQYRFTKDLTLGLMFQDPLSIFTYQNSTQTFVPPTYKIGIADQEEEIMCQFNLDLDWSSDLGLQPRLGAQWKPIDVIALRAGLWGDNLTGGESGESVQINPTAGFGIFIPSGDNRLQLDYTLMPDRIESGGLLQKISLSGQFL